MTTTRPVRCAACRSASAADVAGFSGLCSKCASDRREGRRPFYEPVVEEEGDDLAWYFFFAVTLALIIRGCF